MFDIGATELLVIAVVMILVVGPKELPGMLRNIGKMIKKVRGMAGDFQSQFDDALKEAELDGIKDAVSDVKSMNPMSSLKNELNPINKLMEETKADLNKEAGDVNAAVKDKPVVKKAPPKAAPVKKVAAKAKTTAKAKPAKAAQAKSAPAKAAPKKAAPKTAAPKTAAKKTTSKPKSGKTS